MLLLETSTLPNHPYFYCTLQQPELGLSILYLVRLLGFGLFFCWQSRFIALTVTIPIDLLNHDGARSLWLEAATVLLVTYLGTLECKLFPRNGKWNLKGNGYLSEKKFTNRYIFFLPNDRSLVFESCFKWIRINF